MGGKQLVKYLLDTHIWIWAANRDSRLSSKAQRVLTGLGAEDLGLLDISIWEAGRVHARRLLTNSSPHEWFGQALRHVTVIPITASIALKEQSLEWDHRDPADRLIVSAALTLNLQLITADDRIRKWRELKTASI